MKLYEATYANKLPSLIGIQKKAKTIHPVFNESYPVTIVSGNVFEIYDIPAGKEEYKFVKSEPCPFPIPSSVRAAFQLDCYDNKMSAIVSGDVFDTLEGYVEILHEFVHCAQAMQCEAELKERLVISQEYKKKNDYMWEINHAFPYGDQAFNTLFSQYMDLLMSSNYIEITVLRQKINNILNEIDKEYLVWQEWKEGLARFLENKIRNLLGLAENHHGNEKPFSRISFYESGSRLISILENLIPSSINDFRILFFEMQKHMFT